MPSAQSVQKEGPKYGHPWKSHKRLKHNSAPSLDFLVRGAASDLTLDFHTKNILFGSYSNRTAALNDKNFADIWERTEIIIGTFLIWLCRSSSHSSNGPVPQTSAPSTVGNDSLGRNDDQYVLLFTRRRHKAQEAFWAWMCS
jgi:hypothetical protein